jgi:hypothetical protein
MKEELYLKLLEVQAKIEAADSYQSKLEIWDNYQLTAGNYVFKNEGKTATMIVGSNYVRIVNDFFMAGYSDWLTIIPNDSEDERLFFHWLIEKGKARFRYSFKSIDNYWQQIEKDNFPDEYLKEQLKEVETLINTVKSKLEGYRHDDYNDRFFPCEDLTKLMFCAGLEDFKRNVELDFKKVWSPWLGRVETHDLIKLGESFLFYFDGQDVGKRLKFLKDEMKRLDRNEDITKPAPAATSADESQKKEIYISPKNIERIYNALAPYFQGEETKLRRLLEGEKIEEFLNWSKNANQLTHVFWGAKREGWISDTNVQICEWILRSFRYNNGKDFERSSVAKDLNTQETRCKKPLTNTDF